MGIEEPHDVQAVAASFVMNLQRQELTAVEKGVALLRLALLIARRLATEQELDPLMVTPRRSSVSPTPLTPTLWNHWRPGRGRRHRRGFLGLGQGGP